VGESTSGGWSQEALALDKLALNTNVLVRLEVSSGTKASFPGPGSPGPLGRLAREGTPCREVLYTKS
jgi:hypothetical protein